MINIKKIINSKITHKLLLDTIFFVLISIWIFILAETTIRGILTSYITIGSLIFILLSIILLIVINYNTKNTELKNKSIYLKNIFYIIFTPIIYIITTSLDILFRLIVFILIYLIIQMIFKEFN